MQVSNISNVSFGNLYHGATLTYRLNKNLISKQLASSYTQIKDYITVNKLDKKRNIDVKLDIDLNDKLFAVMFPKKYDVHNNPDTVHYINTDKKGLSNFKKWVNSWNSDYSAKSTKCWEKLINKQR